MNPHLITEQLQVERLILFEYYFGRLRTQLPSASLQTTAAIKNPARTKGIMPLPRNAGTKLLPQSWGDLVPTLRRPVQNR